jgi:SPP1 family predicted phage head-tail adaptor
MVRAGRLRQRIEIQEATETTSASGQLTETWAAARTCSAEVLDRGGQEKLRGRQVDADVTQVVIIRYPASSTFPTVKMRVQFTEGSITRTLNIQSVQRQDDRRRTIWLYCKEDH